MRTAVGLLSAVVLAVGTVSMFACAPEATDADSSAQHAERENDLFVASGVLQVRIEAPLSTLFQRLKDGKPDAPKPVEDGGVQKASTDYSEPGKLVFTQDGVEKALDMRVFIRGESSKTDCPFPKLKLDFADKEQLKKTPFKGHGEVRINTHCGPGDEKTRSKLGRVLHGVGPVREELTYRLVRAMDIVTYRTRVLQVHYNDTASNEQIDSFAMAMESGDDMAQRLTEAQPPLAPEGSELLDSPWGATSTPENEAHVAIAQIFAGNKDWGGGHNVDFYGIPGQKQVFKIPQDFDLGAIVLGDVANYWKGIATIPEAAPQLKTAGIAARIKARKAAVEAAFAEAEKAAIAAGAVASEDRRTTTDPGFVEARKRITQLFELPEVVDAVEEGAADAGAPKKRAPRKKPDAGADADAGE